MTNCDHLTSRAQRLIEEFEEGKDVRHGIANVLVHLANAFDVYFHGLDECMRGVPVTEINELAAELAAPTLLDRALAGNCGAARQFLYELGMIDENGQLTGIYAPEALND